MPKLGSLLSKAAAANQTPYSRKSDGGAGPATKIELPNWNPELGPLFPAAKIVDVFVTIVTLLPFAIVKNLATAMDRFNLIQGEDLEELKQYAQTTPPIPSATTAQIIGTLFNKSICNFNDIVGDESLVCQDEEAAKLNLKTEQHGLAWCGMSAHPWLAKYSDKPTEIICYCGIPARYNKAQTWGARITPAYYACSQQTCRFKMESRAVGRFENYFAQYKMNRLPILYCTAHPRAVIHLGYVAAEGEEPEQLVMRCTSKDKDRWCTNKGNCLDPSKFLPLSDSMMKIYPQLFQLRQNE